MSQESPKGNHSAKGENDLNKACGKPCPRCNDPDIGYCIIKIPPGGGHSGLHECGNDGNAW